MRRCSSLLLITLAVLATFFTPTAEAAPSTVNTSTTAAATANGAQRKTFFDAVHSRYWVFDYNGTAIAYSYSIDGTTWVSAGTLPYATANFSLSYKAISGAPYVFLVSESSSYDIVIRRGLLTPSAVSFEAEETVFDGSGISDKYIKPAIAIDGNNFIWVAGIKDLSVARTGERFQVNARRSTNGATGSLASWGTVAALGRAADQIRDAVILPRTGSEMYVVSATDDNSILGFSFNGSTWSSANTGGDLSWFTFVDGHFDGNVHTLCFLNGKLYVGGSFTNAGGNLNADYIAVWDGTSWGALGTGLSDAVYALAGSGSDLYVGGSFTAAGGVTNADYIARWDGSTWHALGTGVNDLVDAIAISGTDVYIGGSFDSAGGVAGADFVARFDGTNWNALGSGVNDAVLAIAIIGTDVYVGGIFTDAGGDSDADNIARWDGSSFQAVGGGLDASVLALTVSGSDLYVGGAFSDAGGLANADRVARWDGSSWNALGTGITNGTVQAITVSGGNIYVGGFFNNAGGNPAADNIALWNGNAWLSVGDGINSFVLAIAISGSEVYIGGLFSNAGTNSDADYIARLNAGSWAALTAGLGGSVYSLAVSGSSLYVGGEFTNVGGVSGTNRIALWDGSFWSPLGTGVSGGAVRAIVLSGSDLFACGSFTSISGVPGANYIARWDGATWNALNTGLSASCYALAVSGNDLFAGGDFTDSGGDVNADHILRWDGSAWNALGTGLDGPVYALAASGTNVYAGGTFSDAGGVPAADNIAHWDGSAWTALGPGLNGFIYAIAVSGTDVYAGGEFTDAGGNGNADRVARWDGSVWNALGTGVDNFVFQIVVSGSNVYVGGLFGDISGVPQSQYLARWDGSAWNAVGGGITNSVLAAAVSGDDVYAGGPGGITATGGTYAGPLAHFGRAIVSDADSSSEISAVSDSAGKVFLSYTDAADRIRFRRFDGVNWQSKVTLNSQPSASPALSIEATAGTLSAAWIRSNAVQYATAPAPFVTWATGTTVYATGTNTNLASAAETRNGAQLRLWTNGSGPSYAVLFDGTFPDRPSVSLSSSASDPTVLTPVPLTITFSTSVTGFTAGDLIVGNGSAGSFSGSGTTYTALITPSSPGTVTVNVAAHSAADAAGNGNLASVQLSRGFDPLDTDGDGIPNSADADDDNDGLSDAAESAAGTNPLLSDSDNDSVTDGQEVTDGSNPLDRGSYIPVLTTEICADWNGFLGGMYNVAEHMNMGASPISVASRLYSIAGTPQGGASFSLAPGQQFDLLIHDMSGWTLNSYGKACSTFTGGSAGDLDGRMVWYKPHAGGYDFAFAMPFRNGIAGSQYVTFNTYNPSLDASDSGNLTANWIQLTNNENDSETGTLRYYDETGALLNEQPIALPASGKQDFSAHRFGANHVGLVEWSPDDTTAKLQLRNVRYVYDNTSGVDSFDAAFPLEATPGSGQLLAAYLDASVGSAILELSNVRSFPITASVTLFDQAGTTLLTRNIFLPAHASYHLIADPFLNGGIGLATAQGSSAESLLATAMHYGRTMTGGIGYMYAVSGSEALGTTLRGSYNTFLAQSCLLFLLNPGNSATTVNISMARSDGTPIFTGLSIPIAAHGVALDNLCARATADSYGIVTVQPANGNSIVAHLLRSGPGDEYRFPTLVRQ